MTATKGSEPMPRDPHGGELYTLRWLLSWARSDISWPPPEYDAWAELADDGADADVAAIIESALWSEGSRP